MTSIVKSHFTSRFGKDGVIVSADWSQLEVMVFAFLTQDIQLRKDIKEGADIHKIMYSKCYNVPIEEVTNEQRKGIKACTFHVIYGGGSRSMSTRMGFDEDFCQSFIQAFYDRYPMSKLWQDNLVRKVEATKRLVPNKLTKLGQLVHEGYLKDLMGRKYWFETNDTPDFMQKKGILTGFNPPEIKNYTVQGMATANIHPIFMGKLFRKMIHHRDNALIINTIHDSVMLDIKVAFLDSCVIMLKECINEVQETLNNKFKLDWNVELEMSIEAGSSWATLEKIK